MVSGVDGEGERALQAFRAAAGELAAAPAGVRTARWTALLEAGGRLAAMDRGEVVAAWGAANSGAAREVEDALGGEGAFEALEDAAAALRALLDGRMLGAGEVTREELARGAAEALGARDRVELRLLGAAMILGRAPRLGAAEESAILLFESLIRPALFRLTEVNDLRREALGSIAPARRAAFWWWHEGVEVAPHAASSLPAVAHLVARFPDAAEALSSLVAAQRAWDEAGSARRAGARVVSLRAFIDRKAAASRAARPSAIALAAATFGEEITLVDEERLQVSFAPPGSIVIDLVADRAPGQVPSLRLAGGAEIAGTPVEGAEERFAIAVAESALAEGQVTLVVPLAQGTLEIRLPPEGP